MNERAHLVHADRRIAFEEASILLLDALAMREEGRCSEFLLERIREHAERRLAALERHEAEHSCVLQRRPHVRSTVDLEFAVGDLDVEAHAEPRALPLLGNAANHEELVRLGVPSNNGGAP